MQNFPTINTFGQQVEMGYARSAGQAKDSQARDFAEIFNKKLHSKNQELSNTISESKDTNSENTLLSTEKTLNKTNEVNINEQSLKQVFTGERSYTPENNPFAQYAKWRNSLNNELNKENNIDNQKEQSLKQVFTGERSYTPENNPFAQYAKWRNS